MKFMTLRVLSLTAICLMAGAAVAKKRNNTDSEGRKIIKVTTTNDSGKGSLRNAIEKANCLCCPQGTHIVFDLSKKDAGYNPETKTWCITPVTDLPEITCDNVFVDFLSQCGSTEADPKVELCGPGTEETSAANAKTAKKAVAQAARTAMVLSGSSIQVTGLVASNWPIGLRSQSSDNLVSLSIFRSNTQAIIVGSALTGTAAAASLATIRSFTGRDLTAIGNGKAFTATADLDSLLLERGTFTNNGQAIVLAAPRNATTAPIAAVNNITIQDAQCVTTGTCLPQVQTARDVVATDLAINAREAVQLRLPASRLFPALDFTRGRITGKFTALAALD